MALRRQLSSSRHSHCLVTISVVSNRFLLCLTNTTNGTNKTVIVKPSFSLFGDNLCCV